MVIISIENNSKKIKIWECLDIMMILSCVMRHVGLYYYLNNVDADTFIGFLLWCSNSYNLP